MGDKLSDDFRVSLAAEDDALALELSFDRQVILNDSVVDDSYQIVSTDVRVSIGIRRGAMSRPARMADPDCPRRRPVTEQRRQLCHASRALSQLHPSTRNS